MHSISFREYVPGEQRQELMPHYNSASKH